MKNTRTKTDKEKINQVIADINYLRETYGQTKEKNAGSKTVIRMRDEARKRWTKWSQKNTLITNQL